MLDGPLHALAHLVLIGAIVWLAIFEIRDRGWEIFFEDTKQWKEDDDDEKV